MRTRDLPPGSAMGSTFARVAVGKSSGGGAPPDVPPDLPPVGVALDDFEVRAARPDPWIAVDALGAHRREELEISTGVWRPCSRWTCGVNCAM